MIVFPEEDPKIESNNNISALTFKHTEKYGYVYPSLNKMTYEFLKNNNEILYLLGKFYIVTNAYGKIYLVSNILTESIRYND